MANSTIKTNKTETGSKASAEASMADMEVQIETLKAEIAKLTSQMSSSGRQSFDALKNIASDGADQLRYQGEAAVQGMKAKAGDIEGQVVEAVREKPITSLAIAAGVGFLFALMSRR